MSVGFYSPFPPARTGVADYAAALLRLLKTHAEVRVNRDGNINLYHAGNNSLHASIYRRAIERPGIVVLHDAVLHHFALGCFSRDEYISEFVYNYGDWTRTLAERLWRDRSRSAADPVYFGYPMIKRLAERSLAVVVHNPAAARMVRQHSPGTAVVEIPHLLIPHEQPHPVAIERFRTVLGPGMKFGVFGHLRESKRILPLLRVFARHPGLTLLLAGDMAGSDLRRACAPYLALPNVRRIGYLKPAGYWTAAGGVDACLNLRYPAAGETSGVTLGMMGMGTPVIVTDSEENSGYPSGTRVKISPGISEEAELEALLEWAQRRPSYLREIGLAGAAYVHQNHRGDKVAEAFARLLAVHLKSCAA